MEQNELRHWGVKGMRWGVRRYQNDDGTLTKAGQARYDRDKLERSDQKKPPKADPKRWAKEDTERTKRVVDSASNAVNEVRRLNREGMSQKKMIKLDLSHMTDAQMRERINRANLERQYSDLFGSEEQTVSKGRKYATNILNGAGTALALGSSALGIALAIKELRG